jgi:xanthine/CO dehydrogenase XdhC/CoxF family maturation factor
VTYADSIVAAAAAAARRGWGAQTDGDVMVVSDGQRIVRDRLGGAAERAYAARAKTVLEAQARARLLGSLQWPTRERPEARTVA